MSRKPITMEEFVEAWLSSRSCAEVCERTGLAYSTVHAYAHALRKKGVELPHMRIVPRRRPLDVAGLNRLIKERSK